MKSAKLAPQFKKGTLSLEDYEAAMKKEIELVVREQERLDLDVLVHGEAERNDMVEYFGELLDGFAFTKFGWVQSYGSRCVKPPIIYGDVVRPVPMTVRWSQYAQRPNQQSDERNAHRPGYDFTMVVRTKRYSTRHCV